MDFVTLKALSKPILLKEFLNWSENSILLAANFSMTTIDTSNQPFHFYANDYLAEITIIHIFIGSKVTRDFGQ